MNQDKNAHSPFKFNDHWLVNEDLVILLKNTWKVYDENSVVSPASQFLANLKRIMYLFVGLLRRKNKILKI